MTGLMTAATKISKTILWIFLIFATLFSAPPSLAYLVGTRPFNGSIWNRASAMNSGPISNSVAHDESFISAILPPTSGPVRVSYRVLLPKGFSQNKTFAVVYFLHGRDGNRFVLEKLGVIKQLDELVDQQGELPFIIVEPECNNCYWMNAALKDERWGDVIAIELIRDVELKFRVFADRDHRLLAGISMGGHGAIQLALNHLDLFGVVAGHSPVFRTQEQASSDFPLQFGSGKSFQERDPFSIIKFQKKTFKGPVWIDMGGSDPFLSNTANFGRLLIDMGWTQNIHVGEDKIGGHNNNYWSYHLKDYLEWYRKNLAIAAKSTSN